MPMPVMNIWHVIVLMLFSGMFMFVRMCSCYGCIMRMSGIIMLVTVLMEHGSMNVRMRMFLIDQQERANDHQNPSEAIRKRRGFSENNDGQ